MDHLRTAAAAALATFALLAGCGSDDETTTTAPTSASSVTYERSGGIAGVIEQLRVDADGHAVLLTGPDQKRTSFELSSDELDRLYSELEAADFSVSGNDAPAGCADCFAYRIEYGDQQVSFIETEKPADSLTPVLDHLGTIVAEHTPR